MRGFREAFEAYGADYGATMARFMGSETMYLRLLDMLFQDKNLQKLGDAVASGDLRGAFEAAEHRGDHPVLRTAGTDLRESGLVHYPGPCAGYHRGRVQPRGRYSGTGVAPAGRADCDDGECEQGEKRPVPRPADDGAAADDAG